MSLIGKDIIVKRKAFTLSVPYFELKTGEVKALLGPSGSGKTTLITVLGGLEKPDSGTLIIDGEPLTPKGARKKMAAVFQFPYLIKGSVEHNVGYGLRLRHVSTPIIKQKVDEALELVGLDGYQKRSAHELSGGEQQRVALARALVLDPQVLILDEPLSSLDENLKRTLSSEFSHILRERKISALYVTHDLNEALTIADKLVILKDGKIVSEVDAKTYWVGHSDPWVRSFLHVPSAINGRVETAVNGSSCEHFVQIGEERAKISLVDCTDEKSRVILDLGAEVDVFLSPHEVLLIRPEDLSESPKRWFKLIGTIEGSKALGESMMISVATSAGLVDALILRRQWDRLQVRDGDPIAVLADAESIQLASKKKD